MTCPSNRETYSIGALELRVICMTFYYHLVFKRLITFEKMAGRATYVESPQALEIYSNSRLNQEPE